MRNLVFVLVVATTACKGNSTDCDKLFDKTVSLAPEGFRDKLQAKKAESIAKCEKMSPEARQCAADASTLEELQKCPHS